MSSIQLFQGLNSIEQARLLGKMERVSLPENSVVFLQDQPGDCMYILSKGEAEVYARAPQGNQRVGAIHEGETFGEMNLLLGQPRSGTVITTTPVELYVIRQEVFDRLISEHASIAGYFTRLLSNRLIKSNESLLAYKNAQRELAEQAVEKLSPELRQALLYALHLPNARLDLLGEYFDIPDVRDQLAEAADHQHIYTLRDDDTLEVQPASLDYLKSRAASELDPMMFEHFVLTFVDMYMEHGMTDAAISLLLQNQLWREACMLIDRELDQAAQTVQAAQTGQTAQAAGHRRAEERAGGVVAGAEPDAGHAVLAASAGESAATGASEQEMEAGPAGALSGRATPTFNADLLDKCPNEVLFAPEHSRVLFHYLDAKLEANPQQGFARVEAVLQSGDGGLPTGQTRLLYEYLIAFCDKLGFSRKALEYMQHMTVLEESARGAGGAEASSAAATGDRDRRALALARQQYASSRSLRLLGDRKPLGGKGKVGAALIAAVAAAVVIFALLPPFAGLEREGMLFIGLALAGVLLWITNVVPDYLVSLMMCMSWVLLGLAEPASALSGFSNPVWLLIIFALILGAAMTASGLMYRVSLHLLRLFPATHRGQLIGLSIAGLVVNPVVPSGLTKVIMATPVAMNVADALGHAKRSNGMAGIVLSGFAFFGYATPFVMTAGLGNFLAVGLVPGYHIDVLSWSWYALPAFALFVVLMPLGALLLFRAKADGGKLSDSLLREQLGALGPLTRAEKTLLLVLGGMIVLQATQSWHGVASVWIMLVAMAALILGGALEKAAVRQAADLTVLLHLGAVLGFSKVASELGVASWLSATLLSWLEPLAFSPYALLPALILLIFAFSFFIYSTPALIVLIVALLPLFESLGWSPWVLIFIVLLSADPFVLPYQSEVYLAAYYSSNEEGFAHRQGRKFALWYCAVVLVIVCCSIPFWSWLGLL